MCVALKNWANCSYKLEDGTAADGDNVLLP